VFFSFIPEARMLVEDSFFYLHADLEFFEPLERYRARADDFLEPLRRIIPVTWRLSRKSIWLHCSPPGIELPAHGWKIHLSATPANSPAVLTTAARLLVRAEVPFKFAADKAILLLLNGKRWSRGGAGKFVTIYPADTEQCGQLLERLHQALIGYTGPYILSDRRTVTAAWSITASVAFCPPEGWTSPVGGSRSCNSRTGRSSTTSGCHSSTCLRECPILSHRERSSRIRMPREP
jgi:hypothetical protein